jgi:hypothetical protein
MMHSNSKPKRSTQATSVATPNCSSLKMKQQRCENVAVKSKSQEPKVPTEEGTHNYSIGNLEKSLKNLSLSKPLSTSNTKDAMFSILGKNALHIHYGKATRWTCSSSFPKSNLLSPEPLLRNDAFKLLMNLVCHDVGTCRIGEERSYHNRARDMLEACQLSVCNEKQSEDGSCRPDMLVQQSMFHESFILECKAVKKVNQVCFHQLRRYLDKFGFTFGCLVNFGVWPPELFLMTHCHEKVDQILATNDVNVAKTSATKNAMEDFINIPSGFTRTPQGLLIPVRDIQDESKQSAHILALEGANIARTAMGKYINAPSGFTRTPSGYYRVTDIHARSEVISSSLPVSGIPTNRKIPQSPKTNRRNGVVHRSGSQLRARSNKKDNLNPLGLTKRLSLNNTAEVRRVRD